MANNTGFGTMDDLTYSYNGNQLKAVDDNIAASAAQGFVDGAELATEYSYDGNGNMTSDANKGITAIAYSHLNLPTQITFATGNISYIYDATGTKMRKTVSTGATTDYAGNYVYENGTLQFFNHAEGYVEPDGSGGYDYVYQYKDQIENVRLSYSDLDGNGSIDPNTEILHERNYYPFGLLHKGYNNVINGTVNNRHQYQDQEFTEDLGLNVHEWKFRFSDPAIGRFWSIDPLAEEYNYQSPYNFSENRVIDGFELEGLEFVPINGDGIARSIESSVKEIYNDVKGFFNQFSEPDDINVNNVGFDVGAGVKNFKLGNLATISAEGSLASLSFDKNNNELNLTGPSGSLGIFLGNKDVGLSLSGESINIGLINKDVSIGSSEAEFNFFDIGLGKDNGATGGAHLAQFSLFNTDSKNQWFQGNFGNSGNPNRLIDANGDGNMESMLIIGGEAKLGVKFDFEWNVDQTMSRFLGGSGLGSEWKKD
ncbi:RHS repeat-associated core domain-containing protein [Arenibacter sp. GZD96]|uniref:RHS repeat domain-containing protein n=1 Tax=Aurantibrevibacter litoralis TaxID=3106030 RepID=UPI002AFEBD20|nr:RHS repeat-associated core domain-containing protein [Arenibacter sp. GZD-96]MEA1786099.1 RHS repeat-associated core domain-containing protein [Arenibacter sp. GZD-96]